MLECQTAMSPDPVQRIMFVYLKTGGGHISAARALARDIEARYPPDQVEIHLVNGMGERRTLSSRFVENGYTLVSLHFPLIWRIIYNLGSWRAVMNMQTNAMRLQRSDYLADYIREHRITKVVLLHFLMIRPLRSALLRLGKPDLPALTVVLDPFTIHNMWVYRQFMPIVAFSEQARTRIVKRLGRLALPGSPAADAEPPVAVMPPILDKKFAQPRSAADNAAMRAELGLAPDKPVILLAGGGDGLPDGERYLRALARSGLDVQIVMVCGKNKIQYDLANLVKSFHPGLNIKIFGFVSIMYELMNLADVVVTKGGPATVFEVLSLRKPMVVTKYLYGQEQGNVDYVVRNGLGWYAPKPGDLVNRVAELLAEPKRFDCVRERLNRLRIGIGTSQIADHIIAR